jgi:TetR/AcrR family transcriptional regulator, regulator of cefoperazone and chloramphenicol sensitivity
MNLSVSDLPKPAKAQRSDGLEARATLLNAALKLFAEQGFAKTSIREIAQAAGANIAAINYYFGDKAGLYRAVFSEPMGSCAQVNESLLQWQQQSLSASLSALYAAYLQPMAAGDVVRQCMRLHYREMIEPTGIWQQEVEDDIKPTHALLVDLLSHHLGLTAPDAEVHRLAFALTGLAVFLFVGRDIIEAIQPQFFSTPDAVPLAVTRLTGYGLALTEAEKVRRAADPAPTAVPAKVRTSPTRTNPSKSKS